MTQASLTIVEGSTFARPEARAARQPAGREDACSTCPTPSSSRSVGAAEPHPKGRFFPDTYFFAAGSTRRRPSCGARTARWPRGSRRRGTGARRDLPLTLALRGADPRVDRREGDRPARRPPAGRVGVRQPPAPGHAAADRPDGDLRPGRALRRQPAQARPREPTRRTTRTRATACRRRRSRCRRRPSLDAVTHPPATRVPVLRRRAATARPQFSATLAEHNRAVARYQKGGALMDAPTTARGRFITLEGIDGAGKSTHAAWIAEALQSRGHARGRDARARRHAARRDAARAAAAASR